MEHDENEHDNNQHDDNQHDDNQHDNDVRDENEHDVDENGNDDDDEENYPQYLKGKTYINFPFLCENLRKKQKRMDVIKNQLPNLVNKQIELLQAGNQNKLDKWRENSGRVVTRNSRWNGSQDWKKAQAALEDFLYFQNVMNRWQRQAPKEDVDEMTGKFVRKKSSGLLDPRIWEIQKELRPLLDRYDELRFGSAEHRSGLIDASGRPGADKHVASFRPKLVGPRELRLWTPPYRQPRSGLGRQDFRPQPYNIRLDYKAIEKKRKKVEKTSDQHEYAAEKQPSYKNHEQRRNAERAKREKAYAKAHPDATPTKHSHRLRPASSTTAVRKTEDGKVTEDRFRKIQTEQGLFVSALESTYDWRTSYDCLGRVKNGINRLTEVFERSAERETIDGPPLSDEEENNTAGRAAAKLPAKRSSRNQSRTPAPEMAEEEETPEEATASIEYPYPAHEFTRTTKKTKVLPESDPGTPPPPPTTTTWAEATYGRREWHVNMMYSPSSSVHSPPRSPINFADVEIDTIPPNFPNEEIDQIEQSKRRCPHNQDGEPMEVDGAAPSDRERRKCPRQPELCRAWWTHAPDECWIVESKQVKLLKPVKLTEQPFMDLELPKDFRLPNSGRKIYDDRIIDHYGIMGSEGNRWPFLGVRVPYGPMTFDDMKLSKSSAEEIAAHVARDRYILRPEGDPAEAKERILASDAKHRVAHEVHSLAVPIIREPVEPWGSLPAKDGDDSEPDGNDPPESDGSDSEGDEFYNGYHNRTSRPAGSGDDDEASSVEGDFFLRRV